MATERYRVDYHLIETIDFEPDHIPSGREFAQLWSGTKVFGNHRVTGAFCESPGAEIPSKLPRFEIGSLSQARSYCFPKGRSPFSAVERLLKKMWQETQR